MAKPKMLVKLAANHRAGSEVLIGGKPLGGIQAVTVEHEAGEPASVLIRFTAGYYEVKVEHKNNPLTSKK